MCRNFLANNCKNKDCHLYHPVICRHSRMKNYCDTLHCRFYHLVGTYHPRSSSSNEHNNWNDSYNNQRRNYHDYQNLSERVYNNNHNENQQTNYSVAQQQLDYHTPSNNHQSTTLSTQPFLEDIKSVLTQIQDQQKNFHQELHLLKTQLITTTNSGLPKQ